MISSVVTTSIYNRLFSRDKLPMILQSEATECALACLAMIAGFHGRKESLSELRRRFSVSLKGTTLNGLVSAADRLGLSGRAVRLELGELKQLNTPCILHWGLNHFVVLCKIKRKRITVHDPARGKLILSIEEVSRHFTGVALELTPAPDFIKKKQPEKVRIWDLWTRMTGFVPSVMQLILLAVLLQVFALISPLVNQLVIDEAITKGDLAFLNVVIIGFASLLLIRIAIDSLRSWVGMVLGQLLTFQMSSNLLRHVLRLPAEWFEKRHVGDVVSRMGSLRPLQELFTSAFVTILLDGIMAVTTLAMMFLYSKTLAAAVVGVVVLSFLVKLATFPYVRWMTEEQIHKKAELQSMLLETIRGARAIKIFGRENDRHSLWQNTFADTMNIDIRLQKFGIVSSTATGIVFGLLDLGILYLGAREVITGSLTLGMFFAFQSYRGQFAGRIDALVIQYFAFRMVGLHLERLSDIAHTEVEAGLDTLNSTTRLLTGNVEVLDLHFRYGVSDPWVLRGVDFIVSPGQRIVITGSSGSGKSTLLKLLIGLHQPVEGKILFDGRPLMANDLRAIRSQLGVVMQDDRLLSGSLVENISFFSIDENMEKIEQSAKLACVHDDIIAMPMGYQSLIGDMGSVLSGGQKQRILLARALYRDPKILFLDEGTANLDPETEKRVLENLKQLNITQIAVAHRTAVIENADTVFHIENGIITRV